MFSGETKAMVKVGVISIVAILVMAYFSSWFRGFLNSGGKLPPPADTQA